MMKGNSGSGAAEAAVEAANKPSASELKVAARRAFLMISSLNMVRPCLVARIWRRVAGAILSDRAFPELCVMAQKRFHRGNGLFHDSFMRALPQRLTKNRLTVR